MDRLSIAKVKRGDTLVRGKDSRTVSYIEPRTAVTGRVMAYSVEYMDLGPDETFSPTAKVSAYVA